METTAQSRGGAVEQPPVAPSVAESEPAEESSLPTPVIPAIPKQKNIRKRPRATSDEDEEERKGPSIQDLREEQKLRAKTLGVDATELLKASAAEKESKAAQIKAKETAKAAQSGLSSTFSRTAVLETTEENPLLRAYIEQKIQERHTKVARTSTQDDAGSKSRRQAGEPPSSDELFKDDRWLYELPAHLRPVAPKEKREADAMEGGMILGGTGIAEVALPDHVKAKTAAETERATEELLRRRAAGDTRLLSQTATGSFTANYQMHRTSDEKIRKPQ